MFAVVQSKVFDESRHTKSLLHLPPLETQIFLFRRAEPATRASRITLPNAATGTLHKKVVPGVYWYKELLIGHVLSHQNRKYFIWHKFYLSPSVCNKENCNSRNGLIWGNRSQEIYAAVTQTFTSFSKFSISLSIHSIVYSITKAPPISCLPVLP